MEWWQIIIAIIFILWFIHSIEKEIKKRDDRIDDLENKITDLEDRLGLREKNDFPPFLPENEPESEENIEELKSRVEGKVGAGVDDLDREELEELDRSL